MSKVVHETAKYIAHLTKDGGWNITGLNMEKRERKGLELFATNNFNHIGIHDHKHMWVMASDTQDNVYHLTWLTNERNSVVFYGCTCNDFVLNTKGAPCKHVIACAHKVIEVESNNNEER